MGLLKLGKVSLDGTKVKANASKHHALSWGHACKIEKQLQAEVAELMRLAQEADAADIPEEMDIPEELTRRHDRLAAIADAKEKIRQRADERYSREKQEYDEKVAACKAKAEKTGKKPQGREPKLPQSGPRNKDQVNSGLVDKMRYRLKTSAGRQLYAKRKSTVEPNSVRYSFCCA